MCLGIPGRIVEIVDEANQLAKVDVSGVRRTISVALVQAEGIAPDDWVLIHVGFAMSKIDEREAQETLRLLRVMGEAYTDAQHVAVEFVHPVIVGKRALPALALTNDSTALSGAHSGDGVDFARQIALLARPCDLALGFSPDGRCANVRAGLQAARAAGCWRWD